MDNLAIWIFLIFIVVSILERAFKGQGNRPPGPPQRPGRHPYSTRLPAPPGDPRRVPGGPTGTGSSESAADLLPADLWELISGQRRPQRAPSPAFPTEADVDEELAARQEAPPAPVLSDAAAAADALILKRRHDTELARQVDRTPPIVVSLEQDLLPEPLRHAAFHAKVEPEKRAVAVTATKPAHLLAQLRADGDLAELRRAMVLQEILGPPRGLE